jgi:hypothetical protein
LGDEKEVSGGESEWIVGQLVVKECGAEGLAQVGEASMKGMKGRRRGGHFSNSTTFIFSPSCLTFQVAFLEVGSGFWSQSGRRQSRGGGQHTVTAPSLFPLSGFFIMAKI